MDLLKRARDLYIAGRMHDALEAAQAACDRAPKEPEAWWLLGRVSRHAGLLAASDVAFQKASELDPRFVLPYRVTASRFAQLIDESRSELTDEARRLMPAAIRARPMPTDEQVRDGLDPDALSCRDRRSDELLILFQTNHENQSGTEEALRALVGRSLSAG